MTYSIDFRRRVLSLRKTEGLTLEQTAQRFGVGRASLCRWLKRLEPDPSGPRKRKIDLAALGQDVAQDVRHSPDAYQYERAARFGVAPNAIFQALRKLGVTYKKSPPASKGGQRRSARLPREDKGASQGGQDHCSY